jgi:hypothetical protein
MGGGPRPEDLRHPISISDMMSSRRRQHRARQLPEGEWLPMMGAAGTRRAGNVAAAPPRFADGAAAVVAAAPDDAGDDGDVEVGARDGDCERGAPGGAESGGGVRMAVGEGVTSKSVAGAVGAGGGVARVVVVPAGGHTARAAGAAAQRAVEVGGRGPRLRPPQLCNHVPAPRALRVGFRAASVERRKTAGLGSPQPPDHRLASLPLLSRRRPRHS